MQRTFVSKEMSMHTRWHKEKRVTEKGVLRHPADGMAWKHFDNFLVGLLLIPIT
jgi:hypothetical protein